MPDVDPRIRRRTRLYELGAYVLIVAVGVFGFARLEDTQTEIESDNARDAVSIECTEKYFARATRVLEIRTGLTAKIQQTDKAQNIAWADYVAYSLANAEHPVLKEQLKLVRLYFAKLQDYLDAVKQVEESRTSASYPDSTAYRRCLAGDEAPPE